MEIELKRTTNLAWLRFLSTEAGQQGMHYLREQQPGVSRGDSHSIIFDAGRAQGWKECLDAISKIISADQPKQLNLENE